MYANEIYFGHGNYGVEAASRYYFGKGIKSLTLAEAALLAGIVQRPEDQSPFRSAAQAKRRRAVALSRMRAEGYITEDERKAADGEPLPTAPSLEEAIVGPYFSEEIRRYLERTYGEQELYRRGLKIESTLDPEFQRWSEEALGWGLRRLARRHSFRPPRNLLAEGYTDLDAFVDPSWESAASGALSARGVVLSTSRTGAEVRVGKEVLPLPASGFAWTGAKEASRLLRRGDLVAVTVDRKKEGAPTVSLEQDPKEEGAVLVIENASGAVRAMAPPSTGVSDITKLRRCSLKYGVFSTIIGRWTIS